MPADGRGEVASASCWVALKGCFVHSETPLPSPEMQVHTVVTSPGRKMLNNAELPSLSCSCLACLGIFETPLSPPTVFCSIISTENQSQHEPQSLSYQLSVTVNGKQIQIFTPSETAAAELSYCFISYFYFWAFRPVAHLLQRLNSKLAAQA